MDYHSVHSARGTSRDFGRPGFVSVYRCSFLKVAHLA